MRIMITGGTGFIGYHTASRLLDAGHELSLLVRSEEKLRRLFGDRVDRFTVGDVTDSSAAAEAMSGCDGVVHTAAMVSINKRDAQQVRQTNVGGTETVIGQAHDYGIDNIVHVSSVTALYDPQASFLNEYSAPGKASNAYGASKVESEIFVRELQEAGAPIHITYPGSVIGPDDPALTEPHQGLKTYLNGVVPVMPSGNQWVDVRDIAIAHQRLLEGNHAPGRYTLGGHYIPWTAMVDLIGGLTERKLRKIPVPASAMRGLGRVMDRVNQWRETALDIPVTYEAMVYATNWVRMDDSKAIADLDLQLRPVEETMADAIRWLHAAGHITEKMAGKLAS